MARQKLDENKKRVPGVSIKLNAAEKKTIEEKAAAHSLKPSTYLRNLGLNYPIKVTVDQTAVKDLLKVNADLGRLGGLFKMWLGDMRTDKQEFSKNRSYKNIDDLVDDIEKTQAAMKEIALKIMTQK